MKIAELIEIEKHLLSIREDKLFDMPFGDMVKTGEMLEKIGLITTIYFNTLIEYAKIVNNDTEKVIMLRDRLQSDDFELDFDINAAYEILSRYSD